MAESGEVPQSKGQGNRDIHIPVPGRKEPVPLEEDGDVLRRLRGLDGERIVPVLPERILSNPAINTVVVFSGEAGGGKSTVLGQLDKEFAAASVRTYHVFTEDAIAQTELELNKKRKDWNQNDYDAMSGNLYKMILRERERMQDEAAQGRSILLVETMALPAADNLNRGHTALLQLEQAQAENGVFDTFYVGLPANPAIQDKANKIREEASRRSSEEIIAYLRDENIIVTGIDDVDPEEVGQAIKDALARQATRPRLELIRQAVTDKAKEWARNNKTKVDAVNVSQGESEDYQVKAAYMEDVLRTLFKVGPERGIVALSPFDPQKPVEWNVAPFLRVQEEENEVYSPPQKEAVLRAARDMFLGPEGVRDILKQEAVAIAKGQTTSDFLEILSGPQLVACLRVMRDALQSDPGDFPEPSLVEDTLSYEGQRRGRFRGALLNMQHKLQQADNHELTEEFLSPENRKALGMASSKQDIIALANIIEEAHSRGLVPNENNLIIVNMFGTFDPFAHTGHLAIAEQTSLDAAESGSETRIVVSTFATNSQKHATENTFTERLDNLYRAMLEKQNITVLGIPGDYSDRERRREQLELLASFDKDGKLRRTCGSDVFGSQWSLAKAGDEFSQSLFRSTDTLYVMLRRGDDRSKFEAQIAEARALYGTEIVILKESYLPGSGTHLRTLPDKYRRRFTSNRHVKVAI